MKWYVILIILFLVGCGKQEVVGGDKDSHGCLIGAGYSWCPSTSKCQRMWEEYCPGFEEQFKVDSFEDCILITKVVLESDPRKCVYEGEYFVEGV